MPASFGMRPLSCSGSSVLDGKTARLASHVTAFEIWHFLQSAALPAMQFLTCAFVMSLYLRNEA